MSSNSKNSPTIIECKNCRQEILAEKMFLHEGFCLRNNVYCDQCEKVFLKKDFDSHIKYDHKILTKKKREILSQNQRNIEEELENINPNSIKVNNQGLNKISESDDIEQLYPTPSLEYVQMPTTELFQINEPIIIENGQIISSKNKNEFLLPHLGCDIFRGSKKSEEILDEVINKGDIFKENNTISKNLYNIEQLKKLLDDENIINNNIKSNRESYGTTISNEQKNLRLSGNMDTYKHNKSSKARSFVNDINFMEPHLKNNNPINLNDENNSKKKNSIIINNNIITYNSNKNINKIHNFYSNQETPEKTLVDNYVSRNSLENFPLDKQSIKSHGTFMKSINNSNSSNNNFSGLREPRDSYSKKSSMIHEKFGERPNLNKQFKPESARGKTNVCKKYCEYCNNNVDTTESNIHYKICKKKEKKRNVLKFNIPKPKKREKISINESGNIYTEHNEEKGINNNNKEALNRQFNTALNLITLNNERKIMRGNISNPERKKRVKKIIKDNNMKNLFNVNEENIDRNFPRDSRREDHNSKALKGSNKYYQIKRNNNMSVDGNHIFSYNKNELRLKYSIKPAIVDISNEEIDPWIFYSNDGNNKDNRDNLDIIKKPKTRKIMI